MDCTRCKTKGCRNSEPCINRSAEYLDWYLSDENRHCVKAASKLIDDGRAGTLTRFEEIVEYCRLRGYGKVGVAYCYGMESEAALLRAGLEREGIKPVMVSCTIDGISESQADPDKTSSAVSCNPLGQANLLNASGVPLTILMGLCLGHDILLQKNLSMDFTTFAVKDRVTAHRPLYGLPGYTPPEDVPT